MLKTISQMGSILILLFLVSCNQNTDSDNSNDSQALSSSSEEDTSPFPQYVSPSTAAKADWELLFIGNSHTAQNRLPLLVASLIELGSQTRGEHSTAYAYLDISAMFLDERSTSGRTYKQIKDRGWTHIVLQGQKYSTTGLYTYPTDITEEWINIITEHAATPILFPEHPREGNGEEGLRVHNLHVDIAYRVSACVAPISLAWDLSRERYPEIRLHSDGNHANMNGTLLTAYIFYETITGFSARELPAVETIAVEVATQLKLKTVAAEILYLHPPCLNYP
ncbi:hypothetical protein FLL45_02245 [Aliikangiella marina]|uniref:SGNH/GDSL hydrolase family protein n=1 Tax=Aliikangiella marina TaxID=1712262 RepID=A0A545THW6_9GAMM|nr:hypothetical protein [Aliikangiella marina]TQV76798.1 hypothetical protein FLL45_02245 [Aliikangiella marina]